MPLRIACQMDPIDRIDIKGDSTFALLLEAQRRGHELFYYVPQHLALDGKHLVARGHTLAVEDKDGDHYRLSDPRRVDLAEWDVVLLRQDPPFDMAYITTTHLLERIHPKTLVVNDPAHVRNAPEKVWVLEFQDLMPPTMVTRNLDDVRDFQTVHKDIIIKPLYGNGGASVFRVQPGDANLNSLVELFQTVFREPFMVQQYRPEVRAGDKRIILVDGELAGAINRVPADGETRSNMHVGGKATPTELTLRDKEICARLGPHLKARGLVFVGIDVIGPYLTEINVTSPTGIRQVKDFGGRDIAAMIWDTIEAKRIAFASSAV
ncbi:MAG: glutathione synthase [Hyphomicrobiaceae bacterium]